MKTFNIRIAIAMTGLLISLPAEEHPELKTFPPAGEGQIRHVFVLEPREDEPAAGIELTVGRPALLEPGSRAVLGGRILERKTEDTGHTYYIVPLAGIAANSRARLDAAAPEEVFLTLPPLRIPYNSRIPLVIYTPPGMQVRIRSIEPESAPPPKE